MIEGTASLRSPFPTIDCQGARFSLKIAEMAVNAINSNRGVTIVNCSGADLAELATDLLLAIQKASATVEDTNATT